MSNNALTDTRPPEEMTIVKPFWRFYTTPARYKIAYGGRVGAKSENVARILLTKAMEEKFRILCTRQYQVAIKDSVHKLLSDIIHLYPMTLEPYFKITNDSITCLLTGSEFIFKGLQNIVEIKSTQGINICWVEEAGNITQESLDILLPTIRAEGSEIWFTFNTGSETDPIYKNFILNPAEDDQITLFVNYWDNPFMPEVSRLEMERCKRNDFELYQHIWEGKPKKISDAIIYKGKVIVKEFDVTPCVKWLLGADWGFANDPQALLAGFIKGEDLYIRYEAYGHGIEIREIKDFWRPVLEKLGQARKKRQTVYADNSRPETISDANKYSGANVKAAPKWPGSVEDGIEFIRGKFNKIYVHPDCIHTIEEFNTYSYKIDTKTGEILPIIIDANNHCMDAIRYLLAPFIRGKGNMKISEEAVAAFGGATA